MSFSSSEKKPRQKACYIYNNVNLTLFWNTRDIRSLFRNKDSVKTTAGLFTKVTVCVVKTMSVNP